MSHFSVKVNYKSGKPASDVGVIIDYGWSGVPIKKEPTRIDGWNFITGRINPGPSGFMAIN